MQSMNRVLFAVLIVVIGSAVGFAQAVTVASDGRITGVTNPQAASDVATKGYVDTRNTVAFFVRNSSSPISAVNIIKWDTVSPGSTGYSSATGLFTAPYAGWYHFSFNVQVNYSSGGLYQYGYVVNGVLFADVSTVKSASTYQSTGNTITVHLNAGDTMGVSYFQGTGATPADQNYNNFSGFLIYRD